MATASALNDAGVSSMFPTQLVLLWIFPGTAKGRIRLICLVFSNTLLRSMSQRITMPCCFRIFMKDKHLAAENYSSTAAPGSTYCRCQSRVNQRAAHLMGEGQCNQPAGQKLRCGFSQSSKLP